MTVAAAVVFDARAIDPTGTAGLRRSFRAAGKMRMNMFRSAMRQAVVEHDVLGLGGGGLAMQPPETRLQAFNGWARVAAGRALDGPWLSEWVARAWASGEATGAAQTRTEPPGGGSGAWAELAKVELDAIAFAVVQVITREAAVALTKRRANKVMVWRRMAKAFDKVGPKRIMALANTFCVACHNRGRLSAYRAAGISRVGVTAEKLLPKQALLLPGGQGDRLTHDDVHKGYKELAPARPEYELSNIEDPIKIGVRTAGDEFVCQACDEFASGSPYDIEDVEDTLPMHVSCRCTWFPWEDERYSRKKAAGQDAWNPDQPREPSGSPEGGQFASISGGGISGGATGGPVGAKTPVWKPSANVDVHRTRVEGILNKPALRNSRFRYQVGKLMEEAKTHGTTYAKGVGAISAHDALDAMKQKIGESFWQQAALKIQKAGGQTAETKKMIQQANVHGYYPPVEQANAIASLLSQTGSVTVKATATGVAQPAFTPPKPTATIPVATPTWTKLGPQKGSVSGGMYGDPNGTTWYVKTPKTEQHVNADMLANSLYKLAGVNVAHQVKTQLDGKPAVASLLVQNADTLAGQSGEAKANAQKMLREDFAVDAWLGNRDVVGLEQDNVLVSPGGITRIDFGASLMYRAQGETKEFPEFVGEIASMRDSLINKQSAEVFGPMSNAEISASIDKVLAVSDTTIYDQVKAHGFPQSLAETLIGRKLYLSNYKTFLSSPASAPLPPEPVIAAAPKVAAAPSVAKATPAELEKAKKVGPYYPAPTSEIGKSVVKYFNEKWGTTAPKPEQLEEKVADYKNAKAALEAIQKEEDAAQEKQHQAAKAEQAAAKAAAKAKEEAESGKHQAAIEEIAAELGLSPNDADQVDTLISLGGGNKAAIVAKFKEFQKSGVGKHGLPLTPFQSAMIQSYVGNAYISANAQLRDGVWDMKTHVFAAAIQKSLTKLPGYNDTLQRGFTLNKTDQGKYEVGKIVHWNAFSSCGKSSSFGGNMQCTITPLPGDNTRARDLGPMNPNEAGGEVLYMAHSSFKVVSVSGSPGGTMHVKLQEVETF